MTIKSRPAHRHYTLDQILDIDFDRLRDADGQDVFPASDDSVNPTRLVQSHLHHGADPFLGALSGPIRSDDFGMAPIKIAPPFLALGAAAEWLDVSLSTLKRMVSRGDLATVRIGERRKIPLATLNNYALAKLIGGIPGSTEFPFLINGV